ncbi:MAG: hypothetical protein AB7I59_06880 [Geminicoccaceae bacterium]
MTAPSTRPPQRKLAAIFSTDVAGYGRLMRRDEARTLGRLTGHRAIMTEPIEAHGGLSPLDPEKGIALPGIGMSYLMLEQFADALRWGEQALHEMPGCGSSHRVVIGMGWVAEAKAAVVRLMDAFPTYGLVLQRRINPWPDLAFAEWYLKALRIVGVPE